MIELEVPESVTDFIQWRVPRSIVGWNYTDYSPEKLEPIYKKANFKILQ